MKVEKSPELLKESFVQLQIELDKLQPDSLAYNKCQKLYVDGDNYEVDNKKSRRKSYINTDEFRMIFLRYELFDTIKAARRLVNFVELMYELYGDVGLQRRIRLDDLSELEFKVLKLGQLQILPGRDRAGRRSFIFIYMGYDEIEYTVQQRLRISFYIQMSLANDIEAQRKGCVGITWYHNVNIFDDFSVKSKVLKTNAACSPVRTGAVHICLNEEIGGIYNGVNSGGDSISSGSSSSTSSTPTPTNSPSGSGTANYIIKSMIGFAVGAKNRNKIRVHTG